jgi:hypothetical protein
LALTAALASTQLDLGPGVQVIRITGSGLARTREPWQLHAAAPERIVLSLREPDGLSLTDGASASEAFRPGAAGTKLLLIDYDRLSLPADLVHRAVPQLRTSPVYPLVRAHVALLCEGDGEPGPEKDMLRVATIELGMRWSSPGLTWKSLLGAAGPGVAIGTDGNPVSPKSTVLIRQSMVLVVPHTEPRACWHSMIGVRSSDFGGEDCTDGR